MPRSRPALGLALLAGVTAALAGAQAPPPATADKPGKAAKAPALKKSPLDAIEGYKRHVIEGFTVLVSTEVLEADTAKYERKPLEVLELELKMVVKVLPPKTVDLFRRLVLWAEWDETVTLPNGRGGSPVAIYYGGDQLSLHANGQHPLKAKTVTVLSMRALTEEHQPKADSGRCVLMHELAHVVHDQLVGRDHPGIKLAFQQAMQRRLYDRDAYVTTSEAEFFAELTNAYFDQLGYFPRTRADLLAHDPVSFQVIDAVWGTGKKPVPAKKPDAPAAVRPDVDSSVTLADVTFGEPAHGAVSRDALAGKVVVIAAWGPGDAPLLNKLARLAAELGPHGAAVVVARAVADERVEKAVAEMQASNVDFPVVDGAVVKDNLAPQGRPLPPGQAIVLGPDGKAVFRGSGYAVLEHARAAVGRDLVQKFAPPGTPKALAPAVTALTSGEPLLAAVPKLTAAANTPDAGPAAKAVLAGLLAPGQEALAEAQRSAKAEPVAAFQTAERLAAAWKGTAVGAKAAALEQALLANPAVGKELKARKVLAKVLEIDKQLSGQAGSFDPTSSEFQRRYEVPIKQLGLILEQMRKQHPDADATAEAARIAKEYGIE